MGRYVGRDMCNGVLANTVGITSFALLCVARVAGLPLIVATGGGG